ncbi:acylneuraminate cytidylyltransferase family protein [Photobacterium sp. J15]|uniref:acylneuraminate cytidylyltransferase family protein n=1 Tax=Photobacterium sp. J15 TaxID=265901 RepID=UPI0007E44162|nr:acylneuraminate cytidylyltransferase family protein [Photobacterium sp. J15]
MNRILAIIPARGGSKRLPRKNVLPLAGKPLIQWAIDAAKEVASIDTVMVSTDCPEIAEISKQCGAEVPYLRSAELSSDTASSIDVVLDVIRHYESQGQVFDSILLLQPTSPLRTAADIEKAVALMAEKDANGVVSVTECEHSPLWCNTLPDDLGMDNFIPEELTATRSQDLPTYYRLNGAVYLVKTNVVKKESTLFPKQKSFALVMDNNHSVDIDNELDFRLAEMIKASKVD